MGLVASRQGTSKEEAVTQRLCEVWPAWLLPQARSAWTCVGFVWPTQRPPLLVML